MSSPAGTAFAKTSARSPCAARLAGRDACAGRCPNPWRGRCPHAEALPPVIDVMRLGVLILCPTDITVRAGEVSWDWDPPILTDADISRAPIGVHVPEQAEGSPYAGQQVILKFMNFWTLETPPGWSLMFMHPQGYPDLPFTTLGGVVDCDSFKDGYVHFPAVLTPGFDGVIAKGTPVAQAVPVQKETALDIAVMSPVQIAANRSVQDDLARKPGQYRKLFRR